MLDIKLIRENSDAVRDRLSQRGSSYDISPLLDLDAKRRELEVQRTELQTRSNEIGKTIGQSIKNGADPKGEEVAALRQEGNDLKKQIGELEPTEKEIKEQLEALLLGLPNLPSETTPVGKDETENVEVDRWGDDRKISHEVLPHWEIAEKMGILMTDRAVKVAQSRFIALVGAGAALERALISFMLDRQTAAGYTEVLPPILVNSASLQGTGQLPKFAEESFKCADDDLWLTPTAEVPLTNLYRDEVLDGESLPIYHCAFTPCFRREAGSYGKDTRGLIRLHQFNKVELVKIVRPDESEAEHQSLLKDAQAILEALELPYRTIELCSGDLGFGAQKCYDLEVWLPSAGTYREISSCSNFGEFQARRASIRFREKGKKGTQFAHTLNGSGLAIGRTMAAILENYQLADGTIRVPEVLEPYLNRDVL
ncbi:MAG: serine--tRNA ligase [Geitlerinemataceae cyanobacterium]